MTGHRPDFTWEETVAYCHLRSFITIGLNILENCPSPEYLYTLIKPTWDRLSIKRKHCIRWIFESSRNQILHIFRVSLKRKLAVNGKFSPIHRSSDLVRLNYVTGQKHFRNIGLDVLLKYCRLSIVNLLRSTFLPASFTANTAECITVKIVGDFFFKRINHRRPTRLRNALQKSTLRLYFSIRCCSK